MEGLWFLTIVIAPFVLLFAIYWGWLRNRNTRNREQQVEQSEEGAKRLRKEIRRDPQYQEE